MIDFNSNLTDKPKTPLKTLIIEVVGSLAIGLMFAALLLHGLDALFY